MTDEGRAAPLDAGDPGPTTAGPKAPTDRAEAEIALRAARIATLSDELRAVRKELRAVIRERDRARADLAALRRRRAVRMALQLTGAGRRLGSLGRRRRSSSGADPSASASVALSASEAGPGPATFRAALLARLAATDASAAPMRIALAGETARLGDALTGLGWRVTSLPPGSGGPDAPAGPVDAVISGSSELDVRALPDGTVAVAWVDGPPEAWLASPWFDDYDLVLTLDAATAARIDGASAQVARVPGTPGAPATKDALATFVRDELAAWARGPQLDIAIGVPSWEAAPGWGDTHFARALQRALRRRAHAARVRIRPDWERASSARADAVIHLFGLVERRVRADQVNVLWVISHPDLVTDAYVSRQDVVFVAADAFAARLAARTGREILPLHQATDPERFRPVQGGPAHDLLFVANSRGVRRRIVDELAPTVRDLAVYGRAWTPDLLDPRHLRGDHIPNEDLAAAYSAARIVLNDHWPDMAAEGFLSNRLYDAAACGAFVVSDRVEGIDAEFDGGVVAFTDGAELRALVDRYLADEDGRAAHAMAARDAVLARHTFAHRAERILEVIGPLLADRRPS